MPIAGNPDMQGRSERVRGEHGGVQPGVIPAAD